MLGGRLLASSMIEDEHIRALLYPRGVAVVGATERAGSVGQTICKNLMDGGLEHVYFVNPKYGRIFGDRPCYPSVKEIDQPNVDLVIVITPAHTCERVLQDCANNGSVRAVIVIAAGFKEVGPEGLALEQRLVDIASEHNMAIVGPNCLGVQAPHANLNATFAADMAKKGSLAFISQSGAICTAILDWSLEANVGFSAFISLGSMSHVDWSSLIKFLGKDDNTSAIIIYMESIGNAQGFLEAARAVTPHKPIVVIKSGRSEAAAEAAKSHTGSLTGTYSNFVVAMKHCGVIVVDHLGQFQAMAHLLATQTLPSAGEVTIVTNAGGPGVLLTDAIDECGLSLAKLDDQKKTELSEFLPQAWSHSNPIDVLGDASAETYRKTVDVLLRSKDASSLMVLLSPQSVTEPFETAQAVEAAVATARREHGWRGAVSCVWMGGQSVLTGRNYLNERHIPCYNYPEDACRALGPIVNRPRLGASATLTKSDAVTKCKDRMRKSIEEWAGSAMTDGSSHSITLSEYDSKKLLELYGINCFPEIIVCKSADECVREAARLSQASAASAVVMKIHSNKITHKSDIGGVKLNLKTEAEVTAAFEAIKVAVEGAGADFEGVSMQPMLVAKNAMELCLGSTSDTQFGPFVLFGRGGTHIEVHKDTALRMAPLASVDEAKALISETRLAKILVDSAEKNASSRVVEVPLVQLYELVQRFSQFVADLWEFIEEVDLNPLLATRDQIHVLDARVVLRTTTDGAAPPATVPASAL